MRRSATTCTGKGALATSAIRHDAPSNPHHPRPARSTYTTNQSRSLRLQPTTRPCTACMPKEGIVEAEAAVTSVSTPTIVMSRIRADLVFTATDGSYAARRLPEGGVERDLGNARERLRDGAILLRGLRLLAERPLVHAGDLAPHLHSNLRDPRARDERHCRGRLQPLVRVSRLCETVGNRHREASRVRR